MPNPHFDISIVQRSKGKLAVAGAAYQSGEKLFSEYDQTYKDTEISTALFTRKFFFHPMPRRNIQTGQRSGTLRRKWKSNGTPSLPGDLFSPSPERYQVNSIRRWSGTTAKNTLSQKECAVTLPSTIPTHRDTIHIAM